MSIDRLPTEALCNIFELCDLSGPSVYENAPLVLTHVCRLWRAIAADDPWLWTELVLDKTAYKYQYLSLIVSYYTRKLLSLPLSISIDLRRNDRSEERIRSPDFLAAIQSLNTVMKQCSELVIDHDGNTTPALALLLPKGFNFSNLKVLRFTSMSPTFPLRRDLRIATPNLRQLVSNTLSLPFCFHTISLRSLVVSEPSVLDDSTTATAIFGNLRNLPMLEEIDVTCTVIRNVRTPHVTLAHLKSLILRMRSKCQEPTWFVGKLDAPSLRTLQIESSTTYSLLVDLREYNTPLVTRLHVQEANLKNVVIVNLKHLQCLETLVLVNCIQQERIFDNLVPPDLPKQERVPKYFRCFVEVLVGEPYSSGFEILNAPRSKCCAIGAPCPVLRNIEVHEGSYSFCLALARLIAFRGISATNEENRTEAKSSHPRPLSSVVVRMGSGKVKSCDRHSIASLKFLGVDVPDLPQNPSIKLLSIARLLISAGVIFGVLIIRSQPRWIAPSAIHDQVIGVLLELLYSSLVLEYTYVYIRA